MKTRICKTCKEEKPTSEFYKTGIYKETVLYKPNCKTCLNKEQKKRYQDRLNSLVSKWECVHCGYNKSRAALDFHHLDSTKKDFTIAARLTSSLKTLAKEIKKCILLCANCHRELHEGLWILD